MKRTFALGIALLATIPLPALSQDVATVDIDKITCRAMLKMDAPEQEFTLVYFHGFLSGAKNERVFDGPRLRAVTESVFDTCIDNPSSTLMTVLETQR